MTGVWPLIKIILRRDRIKLPIWILGISGSLLSIVPLLKDLYGDQKSLESLYATFGTNPAGLFLTGPMDGASFGALITIETVLWWGLAVAFMNTMLVVRHTRQNEESGAQELLLSGRVHRASSLIAVLTVSFAVNTILGGIIGGGLAVLESSWGVSGALLFGFSMGAFGFVWAVIAGIVVQLVGSARSANGLLAGLVGTMFVVRGIGDFTGSVGSNGLIQPGAVSWVSPFGWMQANHALTAPEWWPLIIPLLFVVVAIPCALWLLNSRDVGASILPEKKGNARASALLKTQLGLTWRLQKNVFIGWLIGAIAMVVSVGVLVPEMSTIYESNDSAMQLIEALGGDGELIPAFLSAMLMITSVLVFAYVIHALGRLRTEESNGYLEILLSTQLSRGAWLARHGVVVALGGMVMLVLSGTILAISVNIATDTTADVAEYIYAALSYFPVVLLFGSLYVLLFGVVPRIAGLVTWLLFGFVAFMSWLGPMLQFDDWVYDLSPLEYVNAAPAEDIDVQPLAIMTGFALVLIATGVVAWRVRDIDQ